MVVLALALGYFAFDKFVLSPQREAEQATEAARAEGAQRGAGRVLRRQVDRGAAVRRT